LATYGAGVFSRVQGESAWQQGLPRSRLGAIAYSPAYAKDQTLFTGTFNSVLKSSDGGATWKRIPIDYPDPVYPHPNCEGGGAPPRSARLVKKAPRLFSFQFSLDFAFSPAYDEDKTIFAGYRPEGLLRSIDGGATFSKVWGGCGRPVLFVAVSPAYSNDQTVFAWTFRGIYRSRDRGETWQLLKAFPGRLSGSGMGISPGFESDRTVYVAGERGLWRSSDAGDTWKRVAIAGAHEPIAVGGFAVSPFPGKQRELLIQVASGPLYVCRDGDDGFEATAVDTPLEFGQMRVFARDRVPLLAYSPDYPKDGTIYAASMDQLFRSTDRGATWALIDRSLDAARPAKH
jgi:photosystem II stability/assembly factor-like uncharacterized protein